MLINTIQYLLRFLVFPIRILLHCLIGEAHMLGLDALLNRFLDFKQMHRRAVRSASHHVYLWVEIYASDKGFARASPEFLKKNTFLCTEYAYNSATHRSCSNKSSICIDS